jgi:hypothetical protein
MGEVLEEVALYFGQAREIIMPGKPAGMGEAQRFISVFGNEAAAGMHEAIEITREAYRHDLRARVLPFDSFRRHTRNRKGAIPKDRPFSSDTTRTDTSRSCRLVYVSRGAFLPRPIAPGFPFEEAFGFALVDFAELVGGFAEDEGVALPFFTGAAFAPFF